MPIDSGTNVERGARALLGVAAAALVVATGCRGCEADVVRWVEREANPVTEPADFEPLVDRAAGHSLILLGEATHGTEEFYSVRRELTQALVRREAVDFVAVEGDWALLVEVNAWVRGGGDDGDGRRLVEGLDRWPDWMWANEQTLKLVTWLREWNTGRPEADRVGIYGVDVGSPEQNARDLVDWLDDARAERVEDGFACVSEVARGGGLGRLDDSEWDACERELEAAVAALEDAPAAERAPPARDPFYLGLSARSLRQAIRRERAEDEAEAWNARAGHFFDVASRLLGREGAGGAGVVWAHNTHIGDARATPMADSDRENIGELANRNLGDSAVFQVGLGTDRGEVLAAPRWGAAPETLAIETSASGSLEAYFRDHGPKRFFALIGDSVPRRLARRVPHWAIGVVWDGEGEGVYVPTDLADRYDAFVWIEHTSALELLQ